MSDFKKPKPSNINYDDYNVGDMAWHAKTVTEADVILFAGITGDFNPLHINDEFATTQQFGKRVVHGAFSSGLISAVLGVKMFGPGVLYASQSVRFEKPVYIGDTLTAVGTIKEKYTKKDGKLKFLKIETNVYNQNDAIVTSGEAVVLVM